MRRKCRHPIHVTPSSIDFKQLITIVVGEGDDAETFYSMKAFLTYKCQFFRACLSRPFKEAEEGIVKLPKDDPRIFEFFIRYLYTQRIFDHNCNSKTRAQTLSYFDHCQLWILGDKLGCATLQDAVINEMHETFVIGDQAPPEITTHMTTEEYALVWRNTAPKCALRRFVIGALVKASDWGQFEAWDPSIQPPYEVVAEMLGKIHSFIVDRLGTMALDFREVDLCAYHVNGCTA